MATEIWIAIAATAAATTVIIVALLLLIHWAVGRSVRSEVGATVAPIMRLTNQASRLVEQARNTQLELQARLDGASDLTRAFEESLAQLREQADQRVSELNGFAAAREAEIQESAQQAHDQIVQTLDVMNWTEQEAIRLVDTLQCLQEEFQLEQQIRSTLSRIAADQGPRLRVGRITTDSPFLDFVVRADGQPHRYLSIQIKALGDRFAAESLKAELERAAAIRSVMPGNGLLTTIIVVNRIPDGDGGVAELLAGLGEDDVDLVPVDEFCEYARAWVDGSVKSD